MAKPSFKTGSLWRHPEVDFLVFKVTDQDSDTVSFRSPFVDGYSEDPIEVERERAAAVLVKFQPPKPKRELSYPPPAYPSLKIGHYDIPVRTVETFRHQDLNMITECAPKAFDCHERTVIYAEKNVRREMFRRPNEGAYCFYLTVVEGNLLVTGDLADMWWQAGDPIKYVSERIEYPDDLARKVVGKKEKTHKWCTEAAQAWTVGYATHRIGEKLFEEGPKQVASDALDEWEDEVEMLVHWATLGREAFWGAVYENTKDWDIDEPPDLTGYSTEFAWAREAFRTAVRLGWGT